MTAQKGSKTRPEAMLGRFPTYKKETMKITTLFSESICSPVNITSVCGNKMKDRFRDNFCKHLEDNDIVSKKHHWVYEKIDCTRQPVSA